MPNPTNPQSLNRYSYVINNPLRYTDPTGHMEDDGYVGNHGSLDCMKYSQYCNKDGKPKSSEELAKMRNKKNKSEASDVAAMATILDTAAAGLNGGYAIVGDIIGLACQVCYGAVVTGYQVFSVIPNSISTVSMILWFMDGVSTGENSLTISQTGVSLSVSQDTLLAVGTNVAGWTVLREPNVAFLVDAGVAGYDYARIGKIPFVDYTLPAFINPTLTYNTSTGFDFSWQK